MKMRSLKSEILRKCGYTLLEVLVTVATIAVLCSSVFLAMQFTTKEVISSAKLPHDVGVLNRAVQCYLASGGSLENVISPDDVLEKLKTRAVNRNQIAGLNGSMMEFRLKAIYAEPSATGDMVAMWDPDTLAFRVMKQEDVPVRCRPIAEFALDEANVSTPQSELRRAPHLLSENGHWIWDYDGNLAGRSAPNPVRPGTNGDSIPQVPAIVNPLPLAPPYFSLPAGMYPLSKFPASVTAVNPNFPGSSRIMLRQNAEAWSPTASPLTILPGHSLRAYAEAVHSELYVDSGIVTAIYGVHKVDLRVGDDLRNSYRYNELGGPLAAGSVAPGPMRPGGLMLLNPEALPDYWENHDVFQLFWTKDGSDPRSAGAARQAGNNTFVNTYPGDDVALSFTDFSSSSSMTLQYYAEGKNPTVVNSSPVVRKVIDRVSQPLLPPLVSPDSGGLGGSAQVVMQLDISGGVTPSGARIFYRMDGADPGPGSEPIAGSVEYLGSFYPAVGGDPVATIIARVYPPPNYTNWFTTSPATSRTYFLGSADQNFYGVLGGDWSIFQVDPEQGTSRLVDSTAPFKLRTLALDAVNGALYYSEEALSGWRLGRYNIVSHTHTILGSLASGNSYNASHQPGNLGCHNGSLYYIPDKTDDLIEITLSGNGIRGVAKVADLLGNKGTFAQVGDLATDSSGWMYFNDSNKRYYRYNIGGLTGLKEIGTTERDNDALGICKGRLFGADVGVKEIRNILMATGATLAKVTTVPARKFVDFGSPATAEPAGVSGSLWLVAETPDGPHLHEIRNYRTPAAAEDRDYGVLYFLDGTSAKSMRDGTRSHIQSMCITSGGTLYFCRNFKTRVSGKDYYRPIMRLNISGLVPGDALNATFVGDLTAGLAAFAGSIDPDDVVTGIALAPSGQIYGVLREGLNSGPGGEDYLFRLTQTAPIMTGPALAVQLVGKMISCTQTEDLAFSSTGALYASDISDGQVCVIDPASGSVLSVFSGDLGTRYRGLAVDPIDNRLIAMNDEGGGPPNTLMKVDGGDANDDPLTSTGSRFGITNVEAIAFLQSAVVSTTESSDLYGVDGSTTIYGLSFAKGATAPITDAPFPLRALAYDFKNRRLYYLRDGSGEMTIGSYSLAMGTHAAQGVLTAPSLTYRPAGVPDNLCYFGGSLWYVPPQTDDLIRVTLNPSGAVSGQAKAVDLTGNKLSFDLVGDLAMEPDGWMYFSAVNYEGTRFCRFKLDSLSTFEVIWGPVPPTMPGTTPNFREKWLDALAFTPPDSSGNRQLYGTFATVPTNLRTVSKMDGSSVSYKPTLPAVRFIDFSDYHPGSMGSASSAATPILAFSNLAPGYTYADVGGAFLPGLVAAPAPAPAPNLVLANANQIPLNQQSSSNFTVHWTYDGLDPRTSSTAIDGPSFANGMPPMQVSVNYALWRNGTSLPLSAVAKSLQPLAVTDSEVLSVAVPIVKTELRDPHFTILTNATGQRAVQITGAIDAGDCPPGVRIFYTTDGTDPGVKTASNGIEIPVNGSLYTGPIPVPTTGITDFVVTARVYPPQNLGNWFVSSPPDYVEVPLGLQGGHMDVDTSHLLYPFRKGTTDGHVHMYDKKFNTVGESFFAFKTTTLKNIPVYVANGVKFKIIVANADLSRGGRLVINQNYNSADPATYTKVTKYQNTPLSQLPIYSLDGLAGTTRLTQLGLYFDTNVIGSGGLIGTVTGAVRSNTPGLLGEWRNGALTVQLVKVNPDGTDAFTTDTELSNGGVQGAATSGLLWETTFFWHWHNRPAYGS